MLVACLALKRGFTVNHPGLVVFDEPGQQEIDTGSLSQFLLSCAAALDGTDQAIVSTSEKLRVVEEVVGRVANIVNFEGFILQPTAEA